MMCPIKRRNGRMVLGVAVVGTMIYRPPRSALDVALYAGGTYLGLMIVDRYSSGMMLMSSGCGCSRSN